MLHELNLLNILTRFGAVKSFCGCKVTSVNVCLCCFSCFLVSYLYRDDCVELCGDERGSHWANHGLHVVMDIPVQHLPVARCAVVHTCIVQH